MGRILAKYCPDAFPKEPRTVKTPLRGKISPPYIQNELVLARYARYVFKMPRKAPLGNTPREYFAIKCPFSRPNPLNHAWRTNLAAPPHPGERFPLDKSCHARRLPLDESCRAAALVVRISPQAENGKQETRQPPQPQKPLTQTTERIHGVHQLFRTGTLGIGNHVFGGAAFNDFPSIKHQEPIGKFRHKS